MRTTLTLDKDVMTKLKAEMQKHPEMSFKDVVNKFLRLGLTATKQYSGAEPFVVKPRSLGNIPGLNYDNIAELLEQLEGPGHK